MTIDAAGFSYAGAINVPPRAFATLSQVSNTYTITASDEIVECTANTFSVTLPTAVGISGRVYQIKNSGSGVITVNTTSSQTIDGALTKTLNQYDKLATVSNGTNWLAL